MVHIHDHKEYLAAHFHHSRKEYFDNVALAHAIKDNRIEDIRSILESNKDSQVCYRYYFDFSYDAFKRFFGLQVTDGFYDVVVAMEDFPDCPDEIILELQNEPLADFVRSLATKQINRVLVGMTASAIAQILGFADLIRTDTDDLPYYDAKPKYDMNCFDEEKLEELGDEKFYEWYTN